MKRSDQLCLEDRLDCSLWCGHSILFAVSDVWSDFYPGFYHELICYGDIFFYNNTLFGFSTTHLQSTIKYHLDCFSSPALRSMEKYTIDKMNDLSTSGRRQLNKKFGSDSNPTDLFSSIIFLKISTDIERIRGKFLEAIFSNPGPQATSGQRTPQIWPTTRC